MLEKLPKIKQFKFTEVIVPARKGTISSPNIQKPLHMLPVQGNAPWSFQFDELPKLILEMKLEDGTESLGEFYRDHSNEVVSHMARSLLGISLSDFNLNHLPLGLYREYDGFECAIWDAYAKLRLMKLYELLGGKYQEEARVSAWSSHRNLNELEGVVKKFQHLGYDTIKFKCDLEDDIVAWAQEIKRKAPSLKIIFDPNQRFKNFGETKTIVRDLEKVGNVLCLEDPFPRWMLKDYQKLRSFTTIRIVLHNSLPYIYQGQRIHDVINAIKHDACDGFNFNSGLADFRRQEAIATAANMYFWHGSEVDLGILEAMYVHQIVATKNCVWPSDIFGRLIREHDLLNTPLKINPPFVEIPQGWGLGVSLDREALSQYKISEYEIK